MFSELTLTRREALQGIAGVAASALIPAHAARKPAGSSPWPSDREFAALVRERLVPFTEDWRFCRGDVSGADQAEFDDSAWRVLDVPHDWSIEDLPESSAQSDQAIWSDGTGQLRVGPFDLYRSEGQIATGWTVGGIGWYRKAFPRPGFPEGGRCELRFEGVYMNSDVWLNGIHLGNHPYGYTPFSYDLTSHLSETRNVIAVRVDNRGRNSRWYSGSGIFRKVWIAANRDIRIPEYGISVTTPEVSKQAGQVRIEISLEGNTAAPRHLLARARLRDQDGAGAGEAQAPFVSGEKGAAATLTFRVSEPRLWSPDDPHLYQADILIEGDQKPLDGASLPFGIRSLEVGADKGLAINGQSVKLRGGCVHHDNGPLGSAAVPRAEFRRVELLKANGYNAIRTSHNPPSSDFLDACDRLGMLVIDEAFDCWESGNKNPQDYHLYFKAWWERDLGAMIRRDRNHPSVILWSIGNEINERAEPRGLEIGQQLRSFARALDPTRLVTAAICHPWDHPRQTWSDMEPAFAYLDVAGYNYEWQEYEKDHAQFPGRIMVGTESFPEEAFQNWRAVEAHGWVLGDFVWTAIDYLGESGIGHASIRKGPGQDVFSPPYPWFNSYCGDIDLTGNKKPQSYFRDVVWRRSRVEMAVQRPLPDGYGEHISKWGWSDEQRSWTWPGFEGSPMRVRVYTRGDEVRLMLNGEEAGRKKLSPDDALRAEFLVPYTAGELKAVAFESGREIGNVAFRTAGRPEKLVLAADRVRLRNSRDDLSYVMATVADHEGRLVPDAVTGISFSLTGPGEIAAVANANPKDAASFRIPRVRTFQGSSLAIIRPGLKPGTLELRAESPGLAPAAIQIVVAG